MKRFLLIFIFCSINSYLIHSQTAIDLEKIGWWAYKNSEMQPSVNIQDAYDYIRLNGLQPKEIVTIAVLDTDVDINHKEFANIIWQNSDENGDDTVDNDKNGYIDDVHGWNFIGNEVDGKSLDYTLMEETRILRRFSKEELDVLSAKKKILFTYEEVKESYDDIIVQVKKKIKPYADAEAGYIWTMDTLKKTFNKNTFTKEELNTLTSEDTIIQQSIDYVKTLYRDGYPYQEFIDYLDFKRKSLDICMNLDYDNRELIGDDLYDIKDNQYGSPFIAKNVSNIDHGTKVSGVMALLFNELNKLNDKNSFLIMPLVITGIGDPTDKDTALAIRYAVDNGAKVINLSQSKDFSISDKLVDEALIYAERNDVLIIKSAGNQGIDLDDHIRFPNDTDHKGNEIVDNVIIVGGVAKPKNYNRKSILYKNSNYGKNSVDLYAPGSKIKNVTPFKTRSGTSYSAPITAGVASLIRSYFPSLSAKQVKQILMDSGTSYDVEVEIELEDDVTKMVPFSELSKSGKVLNAYNALLMAEEVVKGKK